MSVFRFIQGGGQRMREPQSTVWVRSEDNGAG